MALFEELGRRFVYLWRRKQLDRDLAEEMRLHVELKAASRPASAQTDARRQANVAFGNSTLWRELCREAWGWSSVERLVQDLRYAVRTLRASPGFAAVAILSLALGIGANTAIFSLIDTVLLRMLPVQQPEQLVFVENVGARGGGGAPPYPCFEEFRDRNHYFSGLSAFTADSMRIAVDGRPEEVMGQFASGNYFTMLGVSAWIGRTFSPADDSVVGKGGPDGPLAVISYEYWLRRFGMSPSALGKVIRVNNTPATIVGVTPPEFFGLQPGLQVDVTVPMMLADAEMLRDKGSWWFNVAGRLNTGASATAARGELDGIFQTFMNQRSEAAKFSGSDEMRRDYFNHIQLTPASRGLDRLRHQFSKPLVVLMASVGLVLLIACANVANLLLARTSARGREFAVRLALGAGRARLMRQVLTESLLLVGLGGLLGVLFANWAGHLLVAFFASGRNQIALDLHFDFRVMAFTAGISLLTGLLFGLAPAFRATQVNPGPAMKEQGRSVAGSHQRLSLSQLLVVAQVALSLVLLIGAGLFVRSLRNLRNLDAGFRPDGVLTMRIKPNDALYTVERRPGLWSEILNRAGRIPGVRSASLSTLSPLSGMERGVLLEVPGYVPRSERDTIISLNQVAASYFETMGIPILLGRAFTAGDVGTAPRVALLNETAAHRYFGGRNPLGAIVRFSRRPEIPPYRIVGVVKDSRHNSLREEVPRLIYLPVFQPLDKLASLTLAVRTAGDPAALASAVSAQIRSAGPDILITDVVTLARQVDQTLLEERLVSTLAAFFGLLALLLASIGLYGTMSYLVVRRTNEIGLRVALGASRKGVVWLVLRDTVLMIATGMAIGVPAAIGSARYIQSQLYGLKPADAVTLVFASLLLTVVAVLAGYLPAHRASRVDPMTALRNE